MNHEVESLYAQHFIDLWLNFWIFFLSFLVHALKKRKYFSRLWFSSLLHLFPPPYAARIVFLARFYPSYFSYHYSRARNKTFLYCICTFWNFRIFVWYCVLLLTMTEISFEAVFVIRVWIHFTEFSNPRKLSSQMHLVNSRKMFSLSFASVYDKTVEVHRYDVSETYWSPL